MTRSTTCVVAELVGDARDAIEDLWGELERDWSLRRSPGSEPPHVTIAIAHGDQPEAVEQLVPIIALTASTWEPFAVKGAGYGVFVGDGKDAPVLHIALTRTPQLSALHEAVLRDLRRAGLDYDGQCLPEHWRPHVNLADRRAPSSAIGGAFARLVERLPRRWTFTIANLTTVTDTRRVVAPFARPGR